MDYQPASAEEKAFLAAYDPSKFAPVAVTADIALFTIRGGRLSVLLVERGGFPFKHSWALPGGFSNPDEDLDATARRELQEETALSTEPSHLEQLGTYSTPGRDPRMRVVTVAYVGMMPDLPNPTAGDDASSARFWAIDDLDLVNGAATEAGPALAFDHARILRDALARVRSKLEYTPLATSFCEDTFSLVELRRVYEAVWGVELHASNFRRKVLSTPDFVVPVGASAPVGASGGRPAELYKRGSARLLHPAMLQPETDSGRFSEDTEDGGLA